MVGKRDKPEEIVLKLRQVEVLQGQGSSLAEAVRQIDHPDLGPERADPDDAGRAPKAQGGPSWISEMGLHLARQASRASESV